MRGRSPRGRPWRTELLCFVYVTVGLTLLSALPGPAAAPLGVSSASPPQPFATTPTPAPQTLAAATGTAWKLAGPPNAPSTTTSPASGSAGPTDLAYAELTYDAADGYVMATGENGTNFTQSSFNWGGPMLTWKFSGGTWSIVPTVSAPPPVLWGSLCYDAADGYALLWGEFILGNGPFNHTGNWTWVYRHGVWTNLSTGGGALAPWVWGRQMVYDAADGYVLLFGSWGTQVTGPIWNHSATWGYRNGTWFNLTASAGGEPPLGAALAYDAADGYVVAFGGDVGPYDSGQYSINSTWVFRNGTWSNITASVRGAPSPRAEASLVDDPSVGGVLLVGGAYVNLPQTFVGTYLNDSWSYSNQTWTHLSTSSAMTPRTEARLAYDPAGPTVVVFGGESEIPLILSNGSVGNVQFVDLVDTWTFSNATWSQAAPVLTASPPVTDVGVPVSIGLQTSYAPNTSVSVAYSGLPSGCASQNAPGLTCVPSVAGVYRTLVQVTTGGGGDVAQGSLHLQVNPAPEITSFSTDRSVLDVAQPVQLSLVDTGGTGPLDVRYSGLPPGCSSQNLSVVECVPSGPGTFTIHANVTDGVGGKASATTTLVVNPRPAIASLTASPVVVPIGSPFTLTASVEGGTSPLSFAYLGLPLGCLSRNSTLVTCLPAVSGNYTVHLEVTDAMSAGAQANVTVQVVPSSVSLPAPTRGAAPSFLQGFVVGVVPALLATGWATWRVRAVRRGKRLVAALEEEPSEPLPDPGRR